MTGHRSPSGPDVQEFRDLELGGPVERRGPWVRLCGRPGPYSIRRPTPTMPGRLQVLTCTRPENHPGPFHEAADDGAVVLARWSRDGRPDWPPPLHAQTRAVPEKED